MAGQETLQRLHSDLRALARTHTTPLLVPRFLLGGQGTALDPADGPGFFASCLRDILSSPESPSACAGPELVYSIFVPTFASLGGRIGSLLSLLPFLSFLRRELGVDTVITLPLTVIGSVHRKGVRGSPFAARDPFAIDESYADTLLPSWSAHDLYLAVVEAAGCLGIRFGSIAPLATLSIDSELIARFPDLTYWWHARPGELLVAEANGSVPAITAATRARFVPAPASGSVRMRPHGGGQVASASGPGGQVLAPANALPDVTPTMSATYTWEDVVSVNYTRLPFPVPHARYMEAPLDTGRSAWRVMPQVLAWRLRHGERALVIDVQSSVPGEILTRGIDLARSRVELTAGSSCCPGAASPCPDGDEPWIASEELWTFTGPPRADAVVGPLLYCASPYARDAVHLVRSLGQLADQLARTASPLPFLAGPGNHDTIPVDPSLVRLLLMYLWFLPGAIPFLFSGAEHGILTAVNREFGFSLTEQEALSYDRLQMFSPGPVDWDSCHDTSQQARLAPFVRLLLAARRVAGEWLRPGQPLTLMPVRTQGEPTCPAIGYHVGEGTPSVIAGANFSPDTRATFGDPLLHQMAADRSVLWAGSGPPEPASRTIVVPALSAFVILPATMRTGVPDDLRSAGVLSWR